MENKWTKKNVLWQLLYVVLYMIAFLIVCVLGSVHPVLFVCYQITAGILLTGILVRSFDRIQQPGTALTFGLIIVLAFIVINDAGVWHILPPLILGIAAELVGLILKNDRWRTIVIKAVIMSFTTFGFYGQIWFNREFTYTEAIEEMPAGYADGLMNCSSAWALPVVVIAGIALSVLIANVTAKVFKLTSYQK